MGVLCGAETCPGEGTGAPQSLWREVSKKRVEREKIKAGRERPREAGEQEAGRHRQCKGLLALWGRAGLSLPSHSLHPLSPLPGWPHPFCGPQATLTPSALGPQGTSQPPPLLIWAHKRAVCPFLAVSHALWACRHCVPARSASLSAKHAVKGTNLRVRWAGVQHSLSTYSCAPSSPFPTSPGFRFLLGPTDAGLPPLWGRREIVRVCVSAGPGPGRPHSWQLLR